jgi:predicted DNA binding protein
MDEAHPRLTEREYERLREVTETRREDLVVRLCGEVGLRVGEVTRLVPSDLERGNGRSDAFLVVREADGGRRSAYVPQGVARDLCEYVEREGIGDNESVVGVTPRRVQMIVSDVAERAHERTGRDVYEDVKPSSLRSWFGRRLLIEDGLDARVVAAVGGWEGTDSLLRSTNPPSREEVADAFRDNGSGTDPGTEASSTSRSPSSSHRLEDVVTTLESVDERLVDATTRTEIEERVCDRLTDVYEAVWVAERSPSTSGIGVRSHAGDDADRFDGAGSTGIIERVLQTGKTLIAPDEPGTASRKQGKGTLAAAPVAHGETVYGVLVVRSEAEDAFGDPERTVLTGLGRRMAFAITATERRLLLLGGTVIELRFRYTEPSAPLVSLSSSLGSTVTLDGVVPGEDGSLVCFVDVRGTTTEEALETATNTEGVDDTRLVRRHEDGGLLELVVSEGSPLVTVTDRGGTVTELRVDDGVGSFTCELARETDVRSVHDELSEAYPSLELRGKQERRETHGTPDLRNTVEEDLTERQRAVLRGAYHSGYFQWPRESTAEDLADSMEVSPPTLHSHLRKAQQKLLDTVFGDG